MTTFVVDAKDLDRKHNNDSPSQSMALSHPSIPIKSNEDKEPPETCCGLALQDPCCVLVCKLKPN
jgi:hypothetical protein